MTKTTRRRTQIEVETHEVTIIRISGRHNKHYCQNCRRTVLAFSPERTAEILRMELREVFARVGKDEIHLTRTERGTAFICGDSMGSRKNTTDVSNFLIEKQ